ncbi:hypothetical protein LSUE1_G001131 [Lachnellula suecica]|uniref:C2H2-type domain-containing protein n=1 Tax=Lachnellula suecica TaxID=602035 RepID=A0A8T9CIW9_9HELO|nr:hypothetical protein LSUE1_G001131 [Lachnellula suecica]
MGMRSLRPQLLVATFSSPALFKRCRPSLLHPVRAHHMHSKTHSSMACPFCKGKYATASGVVIHLESGRCSSGLDRHKINEAIRKLDRNNVITKPMLTMPGYGQPETIATNRAWNGRGYECYLCPKEFGTLQGLNAHLKSPFHDQEIYRCPKGGCGRNYKLLSGLVQHVESESCGLMQFGQVQRQARNGIENMVGRMIKG